MKHHLMCHSLGLHKRTPCFITVGTCILHHPDKPLTGTLGFCDGHRESICNREAPDRFHTSYIATRLTTRRMGHPVKELDQNAAMWHHWAPSSPRWVQHASVPHVHHVSPQGAKGLGGFGSETAAHEHRSAMHLWMAGRARSLGPQPIMV